MGLIVLLVLLSIAGLRQTCHPLCHYECDDPVCRANCYPVCQTPRCQLCRNNTYGAPSICVETHRCGITCPPDQCESDQCPACAIECPDECRGAPHCYQQCQAPQCGWKCSAPVRTCPKPRCVLQCEKPACEVSPAVSVHSAISLPLLFALISLFTVVQ